MADKLAQVAGGSASTLVLPLDFTQAAAAASARDLIRAAWGGVDLVLIVAGTHEVVRAWELTEGRSRALLEVDPHGVINMTAAVVPGLLASGKRRAWHRVDGGGLLRPAEGAGVRRVECGAHQLHPDALPRPQPEGAGGVYRINSDFVTTPLTDRNAFRMPNLITAGEAADEIVAGLEAGDVEIHVPRAFTRKLKHMRLLPYRCYFALVRRATGL